MVNKSNIVKKVPNCLSSWIHVECNWRVLKKFIEKLKCANKTNDQKTKWECYGCAAAYLIEVLGSKHDDLSPKHK